MDLTGQDSDDEDHGIDDLSLMNDSVARMSIGEPKTPKWARPSSQTHDGENDDKPVCISVCINLTEMDEAFLTGINKYMTGAVADAPTINLIACRSDLRHPLEKSVFF